MTDKPIFTVIIPTHDHGEILRHAVQSVLGQTLASFELFIIGDGVDEATRKIANDLRRADSRLSFYDLPKGPRLGEHYRHEILQRDARGDFVAYLSDDDLWLPNHLEVFSRNLQQYDFVHATPLVAMRDGDIFIYPGDLEVEGCREYLLTQKNFIPLSSMAHRLDFYKTLPFGWRTTPDGIPTDLYMIRQILEYSNVRAYSICEVTMLNFPSAPRRDMSLQERSRELEKWSARFTSTQFIDDLNLRVQKRLRRYLWNKSQKIESLSMQLEQSGQYLKK